MSTTPTGQQPNPTPASINSALEQVRKEALRKARWDKQTNTGLRASTPGGRRKRRKKLHRKKRKSHKKRRKSRKKRRKSRKKRTKRRRR